MRVYFSTLEVTKITETKKWEGEDIMVGLGGTLSLFLGISFVAALEYAELLFRLIAAAVLGIYKKLCFNQRGEHHREDLERSTPARK